MTLTCQKCGGYLMPESLPALSWQCRECGAKFLLSLTTSNTTAQNISVHGVYKQKQEVPQAFHDAFAGKDLEP